MMDFYDTHAHLDYPDFASDLDEVLDRARAAGISRIITIGTDLASSKRAIDLADRFEMVFAVAGWHPTHVMEAPEDIRPALRGLAAHPKVVALGETGFDYHRLPSSKGGTAADDEHYKRRQAAIFRQHLEVAADSSLNCVIHQRDSLEDTLDMMASCQGRVRGVFHCFGADTATMERVLAIGSMVSFTGIVTFKNAQTVRETVQATPLGQFMLETDCPFLAPAPYRGKRCEPAYVKEISQITAETKGCRLEELSAATCQAAKDFFQKLK
jgi:TatD DNase family protein